MAVDKDQCPGLPEGLVFFHVFDFGEERNRYNDYQNRYKDNLLDNYIILHQMFLN